MSKYTEDSIQKLDPLSFTRLRSDTYLGSNENSTQLVREIITNCYDEFLAGNCSEIWVAYDEKENVMTVQDDGQGIIPNVEKDNGRTILEMVYGDINTSGKYDKSDDAVYKTSTGAFGIGASLTNFLSHWLDATTWRNGKYETVSFSEGKFASRDSGTCPKKQHGVKVVFQPSEEFFRNARPDLNALRQEFFNMSCVCAGLKIHFEDKEYYHPNGLKDLMNEKTKNEIMLFDSPFAFTVEKDRQYLDFIMSCTSNSKSEIDCFCNYSIVEAGAPITAVKSCITRVFNKWGKENGILEKGNLSGTDIQEGMNIIFNLASPNIRYDSQTKVRVTSTEDNEFINSILSERLEVWLDNNPKSGEVVLEKAIVARKAAEAAKKARAAVKNKAEKKDKKTFLNMPTTLVDCFTKNREEAELYVVEGLSAASSLVAQRNGATQAVYSVRGMMLNIQKVANEKIIQNKEINNLITALGLDYDPRNGQMKYDKKKLRYGKIIAASDADPAGSAIENLLFNILWGLCPDLIIEGHVYSAEPPLFRATTKKNEYFFLKGQQELDDFKKHHTNFEIQRCKGLGEMLPEQLAECILDKETRVISQLKVEDIGKIDTLFDTLYGREVPPRVKFIEENSWKADMSYE